MRKGKRKSIVIMLTVTLLLSILITGCNSGKNNEETTSSEETTVTDSTPTEEVTTTEEETESSSEETTTTEESTTKSTEEAEHTHSWSNATCTSPKTCACGKTSGAKLGHDFGSNASTCLRCGASNPNYSASTTPGNSAEATETTNSTCIHYYGYGEVNCRSCGAPHTHDWKIVVQTNSGVEIIPDEDFCCHSGWYFDTYEELRAHMDIPNVHGMVYLNDGSNGVTSVPPGYDGHVDFYACCQGWANCAGDGEGERIEYQITQEVQFCKLCGVRGKATDVGERVITLHTYDD